VGHARLRAAADSGICFADAVRTLSSWRSWIAERPDRYALIEGVDDFETAQRRGQLAVCFDIEGAHSLGEQLDVLDLYYDLGVRWMSIAYNRRNRFGSGCHDPVDDGLTGLGRAWVARMDRVGMIKCCSHAGDRTAREIIALSSAPVIFSHSNPRALTAHGRNVPDDLLRACAGTGGVVGINGVGLFLGTPAPSVDEFFGHLDYVVSLIGADHVGIGLDHARGLNLGSMLHDTSYWPPGHGYDGEIDVLSPAMLPPLIERMQVAGYPDHAVRAILGENFRRVAAAVWKH
jgi:membrane dipeptidase